MQEINNNLGEYVEKSMEHYNKSREETLQNKIVQEVAKSYAVGGCNYKKITEEDVKK